MISTNLEDLRESFDDPSILVAINLNCVDEGNLSFGGTTEWFQNRSEFLRMTSVKGRRAHAMTLNIPQPPAGQDLLFDLDVRPNQHLTCSPAKCTG